MLQNLKKKCRRGFTIVELTIVIAVIAILAAVLIPTFVNLVNEANKSTDIQLVTNINKALQTDENLNGKPEDVTEVKEVLEANGIKGSAEATTGGMIFVYDAQSNRVLYVNESTKECTYPEDKAGAYDNTKQWIRLNAAYVPYSSTNSPSWNSTFLPTYQLSNNITLTADTVISAGTTGSFSLDLNGFGISGAYTLTLESDYAGYVLLTGGQIDVATFVIDMPNAHVVHDSSLVVKATNGTITTSSSSYVLEGSLEVEAALVISEQTKFVKDTTANLKFTTVTVAETAAVYAVSNSGASEKIENVEAIKTLYAAQVGATQYEDIYEALAAVNEATEDVELKLLSNVNLGTKEFALKLETGTLCFVNANEIVITVNLNGFNITGTSSVAAKNSDALIVVKSNATVKFVDETENCGSVIYSALNDRSWNARSAVISVESAREVNGTAVIEGGNFIHNGGTAMAYTVDVLTGSGSASLTVNGGSLESTFQVVRAFANSTTYSANITVNGGVFTGPYGIWLQNPNAKQNIASLTVTGGTFYTKHEDACDVDSSENFTVEITGGVVNNNGVQTSLAIV